MRVAKYLSLGLFLFVSLIFFQPISIAEIGGFFSFVFPVVEPRISSKFGWRIHPIDGGKRQHKGIDLAAPRDSGVLAVKDGVVVFASSLGGYGNLITLKHGVDTVSLYGHLNRIEVEVGDSVKAGQLIGRVGSTGNSTGNHLHFEWRKDGQAIDPLEVFPHLSSHASG